MTFYEELQWRGLVDNITSPDLIEELNKGGLTFYIGVDPTGESLHIGHFSTAIATVKRFKDAGHNPIIIAGGGTGLIGDPKPNIERPMITKEELAKNIEGIKVQLSKYVEVTMVNNADWLLEMNAVDYLRDFGKHFNVNYMLAKDTVSRRLDIGITYTEFSYMILQSIDFLKLYEEYGCNLQIGGQDQWGNITAGLELIRKNHGTDVKCFGLTCPLITRADGSKFGKSETGESLWLDINKTSSYEMYQYFINTEDEKVGEYLRKLTFLKPEEIIELEEKHKEQPEKREAQRALAKEVITFLHGEAEYEKAHKMSESLFSDDIFNLSADDILNAFKDMPRIEIEEKSILGLDLLVNYGICSSKREAREMIEAGAISINNMKLENCETYVETTSAIEKKVLVIRKGKKKYYIGIFK